MNLNKIRYLPKSILQFGLIPSRNSNPFVKNQILCNKDQLPLTYSVLRVALLRTLARQYVSANQTVKLQYSGQFFSSSSDNENKDHFTDNMEYTITEKDIVREPSRERFGILKTAFVIISGIYFGAWLAMVGATVLEDLEIFVNEDDDDED